MRRRLTSKDLETIGYRIKLKPTSEQIKTFKKSFGMSRFVYNLGIDLEKENYKRYKEGLEERAILSYFSLERKLAELKKTEEYSWLNDFDSKSVSLIMKDVVRAFDNYLNEQSKFPKYHKKKFNHQMFAIRSERLNIYKNTVKLPSIGIIESGNNFTQIIGTGNKDKSTEPYKHYYNARIIFDGCNYWLTFSLEESHEEGIEANSCKRFKNNVVWQHKEKTEAIGIDLGCGKDKWIVDSRGNRISIPDYTLVDKRIDKYHTDYKHKQEINDQRYLEEQQKQGKMTNLTLAQARKSKEFNRPITKNEEKVLNKLNKAETHKRNKKINSINEYACELLDLKPEAIILETLKTREMCISKDNTSVAKPHRENHNRKVFNASLYTVQHIIERKLTNNGIPVIYADKEYPSTQLCSCCGHRQKIGTRKIYKCPHCNLVIDRDLNAAYNLRDYFYIDYDVLANTQLYA